MVLAIDVKYNDEELNAKAVGLIFNWLDEAYSNCIVKNLSNIYNYIPSKFYLRELPCIMSILDEIDISKLEAVIVDSHVYISNNQDFGLGAHLYHNINRLVPVIGVAKTEFRTNLETVCKVYRGNSIKPLYVSSIGMETTKAAELIKQLHGNFRIPTILKEVDRLTKEK